MVPHELDRAASARQADVVCGRSADISENEQERDNHSAQGSSQNALDGRLSLVCRIIFPDMIKEIDIE